MFDASVYVKRREALQREFKHGLLLFVGNALLLIAVVIILWHEEWRLGLALTIWAIVGVLALNRVRLFAVPYWKQLRQVYAGFFGFLEERLAGTEDIRANGAESYVMRRFYELMRALLNIYVRRSASKLMPYRSMLSIPPAPPPS